MSSEITSLGRVQPLFKGEWLSNTSYNYLDNVLYQGSTYISLVNNNNSIPTSGNWQLIAEKGNQGIQGLTGSFATPTASASLLPTGSTPYAHVSATGPDTAKEFSFDFGIPLGPYGFTNTTATASSVAAGATPSVETELEINGEDRTLSFHFDIPAANGQGVQEVDGITANGNNNVELHAVRFVQQNIGVSQQLQARLNIGIPSLGENEYLCSTGQNILVGRTPIPSGGNVGMPLIKQSNNDYSVTWGTVISEADINDIIGI